MQCFLYWPAYIAKKILLPLKLICHFYWAVCHPTCYLTFRKHRVTILRDISIPRDFPRVEAPIAGINMAVELSTSTLRDLGDIRTLPKKEKMFLKKGLKNETLFPALPTPDEDSWLTVHPEIRQTYDSWQSMFRRIIERVRGDKKQFPYL